MSLSVRVLWGSFAEHFFFSFFCEKRLRESFARHFRRTLLFGVLLESFGGHFRGRILWDSYLGDLHEIFVGHFCNRGFPQPCLIKVSHKTHSTVSLKEDKFEMLAYMYHVQMCCVVTAILRVG